MEPGTIVTKGKLASTGGIQGVPGTKGDKGDIGEQGLIEEAPADDKLYARWMEQWTDAGEHFVLKAGDVMSGGLEVGGSLLVKGDIQVNRPSTANASIHLCSNDDGTWNHDAIQIYKPMGSTHTEIWACSRDSAGATVWNDYLLRAGGIFPSVMKFQVNGGKLVWGANQSFHYYVGDSVKFYWDAPGNCFRSTGLFSSGDAWMGNINVNQVVANSHVYCIGCYPSSEMVAGGRIYSYALIQGGGGLQADSTGLATSLGGTNRFAFHWNSSYVYVNVDNATGWLQLTGQSDERAKEDIAPSVFDCLATIIKLPIHQFRWKPTQKPQDSPIRDLGDKRTRATRDGRSPLIPIGFVAQQLHKVFPEGVQKGDDGEADPSQRFNWNVDVNTILATLTGAIQQLSAKVEALEERVVKLEGVV
jgi:Chaperone of endosialidase